MLPPSFSYPQSLTLTLTLLLHSQSLASLSHSKMYSHLNSKCKCHFSLPLSFSLLSLSLILTFIIKLSLLLYQLHSFLSHSLLLYSNFKSYSYVLTPILTLTSSFTPALTLIFSFTLIRSSNQIVVRVICDISLKFIFHWFQNQPESQRR